MSSVQTEARPRQALDRRRILETALRFVDRHGLEALSMRKLGAELGVEAMALYYHVPNKAALVEGMLGIVLEQLQLPDQQVPGDWTDAVRAVAGSFRQLGMQHPHLFPLLATVGFENQASLQPTEAVLSLLTAAGLEPADAFIAFVALKAYVVGHTLWVIGDQFSGTRGGETVGPLIGDNLPATQFPQLAASAARLCDQTVDANFLKGLDLVIEGVRARISPLPLGEAARSAGEGGDQP
jgi:AcrR family transcriptional regulator